MYAARIGAIDARWAATSASVSGVSMGNAIKPGDCRAAIRFTLRVAPPMPFRQLRRRLCSSSVLGPTFYAGVSLYRQRGVIGQSSCLLCNKAWQCPFCFHCYTPIASPSPTSAMRLGACWGDVGASSKGNWSGERLVLCPDPQCLTTSSIAWAICLLMQIHLSAFSSKSILKPPWPGRKKQSIGCFRCCQT